MIWIRIGEDERTGRGEFRSPVWVKVPSVLLFLPPTFELSFRGSSLPFLEDSPFLRLYKAKDPLPYSSLVPNYYGPGRRGTT